MSIKTELKLAYLKDTKNLIKNAIIEKGQDVSDSDTFRSYADKIRAIAGGGESDAGVTINLDGLTVVLPITDITVPDGTDLVPIMEPLGIEVGSIYLIVWNNVGYVCEARLGEYNAIPLVTVGNLAPLGGENTGEPFVIGEFPPEALTQTGGVYGGIIPIDVSTSFSAGGYFICKNSSDTILENLPVTLDFSNGDQTIAAPDGSLVKSAIIEKPANLVPENIMSGIDIAGIIGTAAAGGGDGSVTVGGKRIRVYHDKINSTILKAGVNRISVDVCQPEQSDPFFVFVWKSQWKAFTSTTLYDLKFQWAYAFDTTQFNVVRDVYGDNVYGRRTAYYTGMYGWSFLGNTSEGMKEPIDSSAITDTSEKEITNGCIYYHRDSIDSVGYIDIGVPTNSAGNYTFNWDHSATHNVLALSFEDE